MPSSTLTNHQSTPENPPSLWAPASSVTNRMPSSWPANDHIGGVAFSVGGVGANGSVKQCLCICVWLPVVGPESAAPSHRCPIPRPAGLTSTAACAVLADVGVPAAAHDLNRAATDPTDPTTRPVCSSDTHHGPFARAFCRGVCCYEKDPDRGESESLVSPCVM